MLIKKCIKLTLVSLLVLSGLAPALASANSKTPNLSVKLPEASSSESWQLPSDYPQELLDWYEQNMDSRSYVVVDQASNRVLATKDATTPYPIASMTKVLATYLIYKAINEGKLALDQKIKIPQMIIDDISNHPDLSNVGLVADVEYSVNDLIHGVMIESGNDATSALMWEIYGSEAAAVEAMSQQLIDWGITNFELYTTSGMPAMYLPQSIRPEGAVDESMQNKMAAADVALMTKYTIEAHPQILEVASDQGYIFMAGTEYERPLLNHNQLLIGQPYARAGVDGLKSGYTDEAGRCFVATGTENDRRFIAVAMGVFNYGADGQPLTAYWEIEILLNALLDYPDLYQNEALPTIMRPTRAEKEAEERSIAESIAEAELGDETGEYQNRRDNPITNFMKKIFSFF